MNQEFLIEIKVVIDGHVYWRPVNGAPTLAEAAHRFWEETTNRDEEAHNIRFVEVLSDAYDGEMREPRAVFLARDTHAPATVREWARLAEAAGEGSMAVAARNLADQMESWRKENPEVEVV